MLGQAWILPFFAPTTHLLQGGGCALMNRSAKFQQIVRGMDQVCPEISLPSPTCLWALLTHSSPQVLDVPLTVKIRTGVQERVNLAHRLLPKLRDWGAALVTVGLGVQRVSGLGGTPATLSNGLSSPPPSSSPLSLHVCVCLPLCLSLGLFLSCLSLMFCLPGWTFSPSLPVWPILL